MVMNAVVLPVLALCVAITAILALAPSKRYVVLRRLGFTRAPGLAATSTLEIRPFSKPLASTTSDLATAFPPSQRDQLKALAPTLPSAEKRALGSLSFTQETFERSLLRLEDDYRNADDSKYVFSGFSIREIKALGEFPDYSVLSGVPMPNPYPAFDINRAKPRPYRPFRWPYHQTMSLTKLEPDWWIELESTYTERIRQRKEIYEKHGSAVLQWLPGSELACKELLEMVIQFVCARYPQYFTLSEDNLWLENKILGIRTNIREKHPFLVLLDHIPEDFAIMLRDPETGYYIFRAGMIFSSLGWNVGSKIGLKLHEIHQPIPDYKEKMQFSMDRYFSKMPTDKPIQRGSWGLEVDEPLYMPPGDAHEAHRGVQGRDVTRERARLRVDWQTLRRLPLSGAVVFNFKALFTALEELRDEPHVPALLLRVLRDAKRDLMAYKNTWHTEHVVLPALEDYARAQVAAGLVEPGREPRTLDESPWFPGWEAKWHAQQGF
ncbi:putative alpha- -mannosyltransferase [Rosellinia necatrix]|uniref:Putative alpha--mannosyltransferase n=1 Tax=Rosellinia necatrix TaxID=77044 RepID=A0A1W2TM33_ROSNE|nr:putative alpha- -mannosyltransferase [Rosellinia necatrix]